MTLRGAGKVGVTGATWRAKAFCNTNGEPAANRISFVTVLRFMRFCDVGYSLRTGRKTETIRPSADPRQAQIQKMKQEVQV